MTICSYDNSGDIKFDVDIEMEQGYWNTSSSRLWTRVRDLMHNDLVEKYNDMRQNGLSYESLMQCFYDEQIAKIPQKYYNMDYDVKYAPFADSYMGMAHGNGYEHLKHWLKNRLIFCDTLFDYAPSYNNDMLTIRANTTELMNIEIETYTPVYQHVSWYNGQMDKKKIDGKTAVSFSGTAMAETDQEVLIYGGSNIKKISGITSMNPNQMLIGGATRLSELSAPNCPLLADINSNKANLSPHTYLNKVDLSNCPQLGGVLRLNNSQLVRDVNISGTTIDGLQLPANVRNLEVFKLSENVANVTLRDAVLLKELNIPTNIEYLSLINVPSLTTITSNASSFEKLNTLIMENPTINPISNITSKAPNLQYVRLTGLNINCSASQIQSLLNVKGVDSFGNEIPLSQAVSGKVTLTQCSEDIEQALKETFPLVEFTVTSYINSYTVTFVDGDGNTLYVTQALENGEVIYIGDTPTKTSTAQYDFEWKGWDRQLKPITSDCIIRATFNNILRYYTIRFINSDTLEVVSSQYLAYGSTPTRPSMPSGFNAWNPSVIQTVTGNFDYYSRYLPYPEDLSMFTFESTTIGGVKGYCCMLNTSHEDSYFIIPFEYNDLPVIMYAQSDEYIHSRATEVYIPENLIALGKFAFANFSNIKILDLPTVKYFYYETTLQNSAHGQFRKCTALEYLYLPKVQRIPSPASTTEFFPMATGCSSLKLACIGSKEYPVIEFCGKFTNSSHYVSNFNGSVSNGVGCINLVTRNGVVTDVSFRATEDAIKNVITYSTDVIKVYSDDNYVYYIIGNEATITAYKGTATEIEIPSTVKGTTITKIGDKAFYNLSAIKINAPSVTSLGDSCFYNCSNLTEIDLPNATSIGASCFSYCSNLTSVYLPNVTTIAPNGFAQSGFKLISLPKLTRVTQQCFANARKLETVIIGSKEYPVTYIHSDKNSGDYAITTGTGKLTPFYYCSALKKVVFVTANGSLSDITLSNGNYVGTKSDGFATSNMYNITTNKIFQFITDSYSLIEDSNFKYEVIDNEATITAYKGTATEIEIPSTINGATVTKIGDNVFDDLSAIKTVNAPSVTSLGSSCFNSCTGLTSIGLPSATSLGDYCFYSCTSLASINIPNATSLGKQCFNKCSSLTSIDLPSVTSLGNYCFYDCSSLTSIDLPSVTSLGNQCFYDCSKLASIELPSVTSLGENCFQSCTSLTSIELPNVISLSHDCFYSCTNLTSVSLPNATSLGNSCFKSCSSLTSINLPLVTSLGEYCFRDCSKLASIELPSATSLGVNCFYGCYVLTSVIFGGIGKAITNTTKYNTGSLNAYIDSLVIYVIDPSNPPTLTGSPWGATNATITYEQA